MKLRTISEDLADLDEPFLTIANDSGREVALQLYDWYKSKPYHTIVTDSFDVIIQGLYDGARLVGNPWKVEVGDSNFGDLYTVDFGKQLLIGLQKNSSIVDLIAATNKPATHALRGITFGYDADKVNDYVVPQKENKKWNDLLDLLNITTSKSYPSRGYASTCSNGTCSLTVEPDDVPDQSILGQLGKFVDASVWCPIEYAYHRIESMPFDKSNVSDNICDHEITHEPDKSANQRHWYSFNFIPPWNET